MDKENQIVKTINAMNLKFVDISQTLHREVTIEYMVCPVEGYSMNGKVKGTWNSYVKSRKHDCSTELLKRKLRIKAIINFKLLKSCFIL